MSLKTFKLHTMNFSSFECRHIGLSSAAQSKILDYFKEQDLESFVEKVVPEDILIDDDVINKVNGGLNENEALNELRLIASNNLVLRSLIGLGYFGTATPAPIQRHILENPSWYSAYTPYQAEISQGRLEALFNFQTLISELTGLPISNSSLLDEATAAAEAMTMSFSLRKNKLQTKYFVDKQVLPQTLSVLHTRAEPLNIVIEVVNLQEIKNQDIDNSFGVLIQLPGTNGILWNPTDTISIFKDKGCLSTIAIDPLAQVLIEPVANFGADIAVGSAQRFGVPIGFGGPHAAFFATKEEFKRQIPGRLVGKSIDSEGKESLRLALQTREQHIRRDKATSNICTAQVLLAVLTVFFAIYHGPEGLEKIAKRIVLHRKLLEERLRLLGYDINHSDKFDSFEVYTKNSANIHRIAHEQGLNLRIIPLGSAIEDSTGVGISLDELTTRNEINKICDIFSCCLSNRSKLDYKNLSLVDEKIFQNIPTRHGNWLTQDVFNKYRSESELTRYIYSLAKKDFSLVDGMIPLGSCTMKLNATSELIPISWKSFSSIHPFAPHNQTLGYFELIDQLKIWLSDLTGFDDVSLQPNAGSQGEYAGLLVIKAWHKSRNENHRNICLIPTSAHGTNPASAVMAGFRVVSVLCDEDGNIDFQDLQNKANEHKSNLAALMVTYPSTHGVFEPKIRDICKTIHNNGGQVYLDGANLNAQIGLCQPGKYGADVCHLNLHKTFCIPHGGGGPGVGPIAVKKHLKPFLPSHPAFECGGSNPIGPVSAAPYGSASILPISWMYIKMMGIKSLRKASAISLLSANYLAKRLDPYYSVLYKGLNGLVAHECILDLRPIKKSTGIEVDDIAKRLMDYGFHAPTVSWPVAGTMMVEPTESESLEELDRFCDAMILIKSEIDEIELGNMDRENNPLRRAPHTLAAIVNDNWDRPYTREKAAFPMPRQISNKFWPSVARIDNAFGDRNLICSCSSVEEFSNISLSKAGAKAIY